MPLDLARFCRTRPYLYHLTALGNIPTIARTNVLRPARDLLIEAGMQEWVRRKRRRHLTIQGNDVASTLRDQAPLHEGNTELEREFSFDDLVEMLNSRVFFWPGTITGPIDYGVRHFSRYATEECAVLVLPTRAVFDLNPGVPPEFCRFNSGSPRCTRGKGSPRGTTTFVRASTCTFSVSDVKEVTFAAPIRLPSDVRIVTHLKWATVPHCEDDCVVQSAPA